MNAASRNVTLSLEAVAQQLERHVETVEEWVAEGRLPTLKLPNGVIVVPLTALPLRQRMSESDE